MIDNIEDYEAEAFENAGREARLFPDDREALQDALASTCEIFQAPGEAEHDNVLAAIDVFEELQPYFPDPLISDGLGELIELLHEVCEAQVLDFQDAQDGKRTAQAIADALGMELSHDEI